MNDLTTMPAQHSRRGVEVKSVGPIGWLRDEIDRLFDDVPFGRSGRSLFAFPDAVQTISPAIELAARNGGYRLTVDVPGIDQKDISIELADGVLTVSGEKRTESEEKDSDYLISERTYGAFRRQVALPADVDPDTVEAKVRDGVLKIDIKKDKSAASKTRKIAIT